MLDLLASYWLFLAVPIALLLGWMLGRRSQSSDSRPGQSVNREYVKGFNYLLNEQSDKAVEVFVKALEVDSETVELHLALGGLFRREGQVGRATRIHQNIIARPYLTEEQHSQAVFELAQDYLKAGLYDRAENLFVELTDIAAYQETALDGLLTIYESEKDWHKAIATTRRLKHSPREKRHRQVAHYWCELAEQAIASGELDEAKKHLRQSYSADASLLRRRILEGDLQQAADNIRGAIQHWQSVLRESNQLDDLVCRKLYTGFKQLGDKTAVTAFLQSQLDRGLRLDVVELYLEYHGHSAEAYQNVLNRLLAKPGVVSVQWLLEHAGQLKHRDIELPSAENMLDVFQGMYKESILSHSVYTCVQCGFESKVINWQCPGCRAWDSQTLPVYP